MIYPVTFLDKNTGNSEFSTTFQNRGAAIRHADWLSTKSFVKFAQVWNGEVGGIVIHDTTGICVRCATRPATGTIPSDSGNGSRDAICYECRDRGSVAYYPGL